MFFTRVFFPSTDLAPGVDEIYEESKEVFLTPGHPQDGQVVFYKVGTCLCLVLGYAEGRFVRQTLVLPLALQIPLCVPVQISVDRGLKWEEAYEKSLKLTGTYDGFYLSYKVRPWAQLRGDSSRKPAMVVTISLFLRAGKCLQGPPSWQEGVSLEKSGEGGCGCDHQLYPTGARQQIHLSAGRAEPWEELHPLQAQYWEAKPA